jgi:hypothetical protein
VTRLGGVPYPRQHVSYWICYCAHVIVPDYVIITTTISRRRVFSPRSPAF